MTSSTARGFGKLRPDASPIVWAKRTPVDKAASRLFEPNAVFRARHTTGIPVPPLPDLSIALYRVTQHLHLGSQFRNAHRIRQREILIEVHDGILVAPATAIKKQLLRVACATLRL